MNFSFSQIPHIVLLIGSAVIAVLCLIFFWGLVDYTFLRGSDAKRAHAKLLMLNSSIILMLVLIVWWIVSYIPIPQ